MAAEKQSLAELVEALPPELKSEVRDFVEFLLEKQRRAELERLAVANGWPATFFSHTIGSIDDPTFVRPPQEAAEARESFE
jgi:hypothetical protein